MLGDMNLAALWWAVIVSGLYHGLNPGMGWPLAVSGALMERKKSAMAKALAMLALGHFLAMIVILLPFSMMIFLVEQETRIRIGAGALVMAMGIYLLINRRHPKILSRIHPAGTVASTGHAAAQELMSSDLFTAFFVAAAHTFAMTAAGATIAVFVYFWFGLKFISKSWFNLDIAWAISLILVGAFGIYTAYVGHG